MKNEQRRVCEMIKRTIVQLCETGFVADNIQIRGVIGVTINDSDVLVIHINEDVMEFDECSQQSHDRTLPLSSPTHHRTVSSSSNAKTAVGWSSLFSGNNETSGASAIRRNLEHQSESHSDSNFPPSTSSLDCIKVEENQDERCAELAEEVEDEMFIPDYDCEMADPGIPGRGIASMVGSSIAGFQTCTDDMMSGKVKQKSESIAFLPPVFDGADNCSAHLLNNGDTGCLAMSVSDVTFETRAKVDRAFGVSSRRTGLHVTPSSCLSSRSRTNPSGHPYKVTATPHVSENLMNDGYAIENCESLAKWESDVHDQLKPCRSPIDVGHEESTADEKPFQCTQCSMRFASASLWKRHSYIHTGERPFPCPHCSMKFTQSGHLKAHLTTHTGEKPFKPFRFQCTQCSRMFATAFLQKRHAYTHTGERPFPCPHCSKRFTQSGHLKAHLTTHTGEKPFKPFACTICRMKFARSGNLQKHVMMTHTGL